MGKFNSGITGLLRTQEEICNDYLNYLIKQNIIPEEERQNYLTPIGQGEVLELLIERCYETEEFNGVHVSTVSSFWHFVNFIISKDHKTGQKCWNKFVRDLFLDIERNKNSCLMCSRGLGKSFLVFVLYSAFKMFLYRGTKILIVSNIPAQCVENLRILKTFLDTNEVLLSKKEVSKGKDLKWTERQIEYNGGMLITFSVGTSPKGQHVDYVFFDDILTDTSSYSDIEIENYVLGQLYPCVQRSRGRFAGTGTPLHLKDIYHTLMNEKDNAEGKLITDGRLSVLNFYSKTYPIMDEDENVLFPDIYNEDQIKQIRKTQGELKFQREYLLKCTDTANILFPTTLIHKALSDDYKWLEKPNEANDFFIVACDVATSGAASADFSAFTVLQLIKTEYGFKKIPVHIVHKKGIQITGERDNDREIIDYGQVDIIEDLARRFNHAPVIVEKNNVGVAITQELRKRNVNIIEFVTDRIKKAGMIRYLVSEFESGNIIIPTSSNSELKSMMRELNNFGVRINKHGKEKMEALTGHDDLVMSLLLANHESQNYNFCTEIILQD